MNIITNNQPRELLTLADLPESAAADFDYITEEGAYDARFFKYRGQYYDAHDMMPADFIGSAWDCYAHWNAFAGVLVRFCNPDYDSVIVGRYWS